MIRQRPLWISPGDPNLEFPDVKLALQEPDGLLAVGGDLTAERVLSAYRRGGGHPIRAQCCSRHA